MPFTISHAVAVLPFIALARRQRLVPAALVIGSWIPDLPYFVPPHRGSDWSHSASGPFTIDLLLGLAVFALWRVVLQQPLADLAPRWIGDRLPPSRGLEPKRVLWVVMSLILGAVTHVVWDTFTHRRRWGTTQFEALTTVTAGLPLYKWLQFGSGALGLLVLGVWCLLWLRRTQPQPRPPCPRAPRYAAWGLCAATAVCTAALVTLDAVSSGLSLEAAAFRVVTRVMSATVAVVGVVCLLWHLAYCALNRAV